MQTANLTRVVVTDEETRGSCAVSSYLVSCGQAEQEARPGATVQLRPLSYRQTLPLVLRLTTSWSAPSGWSTLAQWRLSHTNTDLRFGVSKFFLFFKM